ncbi:amidohydrolase family protein [Sphingomonas sp. ID1715]|uniref:metal-dependent hydrolase family protein n=1 Tax=Sphingomonas sp. ID1715 TaxID=1656898 RepID=UPI0014888E2D|nr:amidohydrolase family protein [Sphingomonas sp. ID1715]NNM76828.1 amidohydrolase family protein [Sphingomonas sp. ID1715]
MRLFLLAIAIAAPAAAESSYIHAGSLLAVPGKPVRGPSTIIVQDGRIEAVRDGHVAPPAGARLIDLKDRYVLPGLIDSHVHLSSDRAGNEGLLAGVTESREMHALEAYWNAQKTLRAGFTTVRNLGDEGATLALRDAIRRGWVIGPTIVDAAQSISTTAGHMDPQPGFNDDFDHMFENKEICDGADECRKAVRRQIGRGADVIKIATTGGVNSRIAAGLGKQMFDDEAKAIVDTAHMYGKKVAVHAHGADGVALALNAGADSIEHGTLMDDATIRLFAKSGAYYVPTLSTVNGYLERIAKDPNAYPPEVRAKIDWRISITGKALEKAVPAGVRIAFGTDAGVSKHGRNADEFELMVKHGMTPATAIQAATVNAAELLGLAKEIGTIEPGKRADLIAVAGDPLADVTVLKAVSFVMKDGTVVR